MDGCAAVSKSSPWHAPAAATVLDLPLVSAKPQEVSTPVEIPPVQILKIQQKTYNM
jgi:hypothetical protein